jgi:hypothetical protein
LIRVLGPFFISETYSAVEYLKGETLASRLKKGPLPPDQALR